VLVGDGIHAEPLGILLVAQKESLQSLECVLLLDTRARTTKRIASSSLTRERILTRERFLCGLPESPLRRAQSRREFRPRSPPTSRSCARNPQFQKHAAPFSFMRDPPECGLPTSTRAHRCQLPPCQHGLTMNTLPYAAQGCPMARATCHSGRAGSTCSTMAGARVPADPALCLHCHRYAPFKNGRIPRLLLVQITVSKLTLFGNSK